MSGALRVFAPAKINLALHVTGQRADGYHLLDSLVMFADVGDWLSAVPAQQTRLSVTGPMAQGVPADASNLVVKAAQWAGRSAAFTLEKHLPAAAGIGGGTSDAAAALRLLTQMGGAIDGDPAELGADMPVCVLARAARMEGIGEVLTPLQGLPALPAVLVNPVVGVATPRVFERLERKDNTAMDALPAGEVSRAELIGYLAAQRNDLEAPARALQPVIGDVLAALRAARGVRLVRMSGSGATCFALFDNRDEAAAASKALEAAHPDWWVRECQLS